MELCNENLGSKRIVTGIEVARNGWPMGRCTAFEFAAWRLGPDRTPRLTRPLSELRNTVRFVRGWSSQEKYLGCGNRHLQARKDAVSLKFAI